MRYEEPIAHNRRPLTCIARSPPFALWPWPLERTGGCFDLASKGGTRVRSESHTHCFIVGLLLIRGGVAHAQNIFPTYGDASINGYNLYVNGALSVSGPVGAYWLTDRTGLTNWAWYAQDDIFRLQGINGDILRISPAGEVRAIRGPFVASGPTGAYWLQDRTGLTAWAWYASNDVARFWGTSGDLLYIQPDGDVGIGVPVPQAKLDVAGTTRTHVLQITGGADLAEPFAVGRPKDAPERIEPGVLVVIDPENPGNLKLAREPYDRKVAGVISGANGLNRRGLDPSALMIGLRNR